MEGQGVLAATAGTNGLVDSITGASTKIGAGAEILSQGLEAGSQIANGAPVAPTVLGAGVNSATTIGLGALAATGVEFALEGTAIGGPVGGAVGLGVGIYVGSKLDSPAATGQFLTHLW